MIEQELTGLGILFFFVIVGAIIATKFKQPIGIGLLLIGALIGPFALNLVKEHTIINYLIEFGAIILLFVIGLEFSMPKIIKMGFKAIMIGFLKISVIFYLCYQTFLLMNLGIQTALILGIMISISSTVVIIKILSSKGLYERQEMPLLIGILVIEDLISVVVLTFLSKAAINNSSIMTTIENIVIAITILCVAYVIMLKVSRLVIDWFIKEGSDEIILFIALATCAGFSYLAYALGLSAATGAFLAGSIVASLPHVKVFEHAIKPYTIAFSSLFFISVGTLVNFSILKTHAVLIGVMIALIIITRFLAVGLMGTIFAGFKRDQAIFSSIALMSIGEFSLLIAQSAMKLDLGIDFVSLAGTIIVMTAIIMSITISYSDKFSNILDITTHARDWTNKPKSLSRYIQLLFDEIDIENSNTKKFKDLFLSTITYLLFIVFIFIAWRRLLTIFATQEFSLWYTYLLDLVFVAALGFFSKKMYNYIKQLHHTLIIIIANSDASGNMYTAKRTLNSLLLTGFLFLLAIISPIILLIFNMPIWTNYISIGLLIYVVIRISIIVKMIDNFQSRREYFPQYKKINTMNKMRFRQEF